MSGLPQTVSVPFLIEQYDGFLLDAYGVLVHGAGPLPGAGAFLRRLEAAAKPWLIVTNDASKTPDIAAEKYRRWDLDIAPERIISSGSLLPAWLSAQGLAGAPTCLLGPSSAQPFAGGNPLLAADDPAWEVLAICDEAGFDFLAGMDAVLTTAIVRLDRGLPLTIVVPNPDLIYNASPQQYGFAAGTMASMLANALRLRFGADAPVPIALGKPHAPIFDAALQRLGSQKPVMLGDQLATDVRGARSAGIDAVLVGTGVVTWRGGLPPADERPTWLLSNIDDSGVG